MHYEIVFHGELLKASHSGRESWVSVNGIRYDLLQRTLDKFRGCSSGKEYAESVEAFAYQVLVRKSVVNEGYFAKSQSHR